MSNQAGSGSKPGISDGSYGGFPSHHHLYNGKIGDFSGCWLAPDIIQFIPQLRGVTASSDSYNCLEAHGCRINDARNIAPEVDYSGQKHKLCTCPQRDITSNISKQQQQQQQQQHQQQQQRRQQQQQPMKTKCQNVIIKDSNCDPGPSSDRSGFEGDSCVCQEISVSIHSSPKLSPENGKQSTDKNSATDDVKSRHIAKPEKFQTKAEAERCESISHVRVRGKRLLCPKNATPLYGKTPTWWGDSLPSDNRSTSSDKKNEKQSARTDQGSKVSKMDENQTIECKSSLDRERRQSTAFVVNLENSEQSTKQSLSTSLPSFQINDHLCSYFPLSRRISLQRREAFVRRKGSLASDKNQSSDGASENGTYVVDLDFDDDVVADDASVTTTSNKNLEPTADEKHSSSLQTKNSFRRVPEFRDADNKSESLKRENKKNTKKVNRKKTFVVSTYDLNGRLAAKCNEYNVTERKTLGENVLKKDFEAPLKSKSSTSVKALDAWHLSKESSWNFDNSVGFLENMDHILSPMKLESPTILSKPSQPTKKALKFGLSNVNIENREFSPRSSVDYTMPDSLDKKQQIDMFNKNHNKMESDEDESNLLTARSIKTELLLKPTEEITLQLRKSDRHLKVYMNPEDNDKGGEMSGYLMENSRDESDGNSGESTSCDSIEGRGHNHASTTWSKVQDSQSSNIDLGEKCISEADSNIFVKGKGTSNDDFCPSKSIQFRTKQFIGSRCSSTFSNSSDSTIEGNHSFVTDLSLGQKIVWKSRSTSSTSTEKSRESFIPPQKKQNDLSNQRITSSYSETAPIRILSNRPRKTSNFISRESQLGGGTRSMKERSPTELLIRGSSAITNRSRELEYKKKSKSNIKLESAVKLKDEKRDDLSCLTAIMKYSAQIQLLSGNLLELLSLRKERKEEWMPPEQQLIDKKVTSRLSTMLSTMKASNDLLFDLHDFLIAETDNS